MEGASEQCVIFCARKVTPRAANCPEFSCRQLSLSEQLRHGYLSLQCTKSGNSEWVFSLPSIRNRSAFFSFLTSPVSPCIRRGIRWVGCLSTVDYSFRSITPAAARHPSLPPNILPPPTLPPRNSPPKHRPCPRSLAPLPSFHPATQALTCARAENLSGGLPGARQFLSRFWPI